MIPLIDVALVNQLRIAFPAVKMAWMPATLGVRSGHVKADGGPGGRAAVTVFRNSVDRNQQDQNRPQAHTGHPSYQYNVDKSIMVMQRRVPVDIVYELSFWTYSQHELDDLHRALSFLPVYNPVLVVVGGLEYRFAYQLDSAPKLSVEARDEAQTVRMYNMRVDVTVSNAFWSREYDIRTVKEMYAYYKEITNEQEITVDVFHMVPNP